MRKVAETGAPDGMIYHEGNVYLADLEKQEVQYLTPSLDLRTLVKGEVVNWADTFSIYNGSLYYTNSKIQDAGNDESDMTFEDFGKHAAVEGVKMDLSAMTAHARLAQKGYSVNPF